MGKVNHPKLLKFASWCAVIGFVLMCPVISFFVLLLSANFLFGDGAVHEVGELLWPLTIWPFFGVLVCAFLYAIPAFFIRCPHCGKLVTVQFGGSKVKKYEGMGENAWGEIVMSVVRKKDFVCLKCGKTVTV